MHLALEHHWMKSPSSSLLDEIKKNSIWIRDQNPDISKERIESHVLGKCSNHVAMM